MTTQDKMLSRDQFINKSFVECSNTQLEISKQCSSEISKAIDLIKNAIMKKRKILLCGNGGSAADAQHLATEFVIRLSHDIERPAIPAIALTTNSSTLTAGANDLGYDYVFTRSIEALGNEGDILIGISTSGNSESVNNAFRKAREMKLVTIGILGNKGGKSKNLVDLAIIVPSENTQRIQEGHITIGHIIFERVEQELFGK